MELEIFRVFPGLSNGSVTNMVNGPRNACRNPDTDGLDVAAALSAWWMSAFGRRSGGRISHPTQRILPLAPQQARRRDILCLCGAQTKTAPGGAPFLQSD